MSLPPRHSLFWRLALLQIGFCLSMIWLSQSWTQYARDRSSYLPSETRGQLLRRRRIGDCICIQMLKSRFGVLDARELRGLRSH